MGHCPRNVPACPSCDPSFGRTSDPFHVMHRMRLTSQNLKVAFFKIGFSTGLNVNLGDAVLESIGLWL